MAPGPHEVTGLLRAWREGDARAGELLLERIYDELKKIAASQLRSERPDHTLQVTALVHEAYLRLLRQQSVDWRDRAHFLGLAAAMMRRVLVDYARIRGARKRRAVSDGGPVTVATRDGVAIGLMDLDRALVELVERFPRQAKVVEMRYFAELDVEEIAVCLDVSPATVKRDWVFARAWLSARLRDAAEPPPVVAS